MRKKHKIFVTLYCLQYKSNSIFYNFTFFYCPFLNFIFLEGLKSLVLNVNIDDITKIKKIYWRFFTLNTKKLHYSYFNVHHGTYIDENDNLKTYRLVLIYIQYGLTYIYIKQYSIPDFNCYLQER